ncbi:MAG: GNAT family N-acetyltransferase [Chrysiogenetes bacterium]|nr:GNAT family N-acetyltransferase [Chrysiogenetes bacterium]
MEALTPVQRWLCIDRAQAIGGRNGFWVLSDGKVVAGHLGEILHPVRCQGQDLDSNYFVELIVDDRYGGQGLASELLEHVREQVQLAQILGMTDAAYAVYKRRGYREVGKLVPWFRIRDSRSFLSDLVDHGAFLRAEPLLNATLASPAFPVIDFGLSFYRRVSRWRSRGDRQGLSVDSSRPDEADLDALWVKARDSHRMASVRDSAFIRWRFWNCPLWGYDEFYARDENGLRGYAFAKRYITPRGLMIGAVSDLFVAKGDEQAFDALLTAVNDLMDSKGVGIVKLAFSSKWARSLLLRHGFLDPARFVAPERLPGHVLFNLPGVVDLDTLPPFSERWLTRGDSEQDLTDVPAGSRILSGAQG